MQTLLAALPESVNATEAASRIETGHASHIGRYAFLVRAIAELTVAAMNEIDPKD